MAVNLLLLAAQDAFQSELSLSAGTHNKNVLVCVVLYQKCAVASCCLIVILTQFVCCELSFEILYNTFLF